MNTILENDFSVLARILLPNQGDANFADIHHENAMPGWPHSGIAGGSKLGCPNVEPPEHYISLSPMPTPPAYHCHVFDYINNPDGSIRWLYPAWLNRPVFLKLYNGAGWRGFAFSNVLRLAFLLGMKNRVKSGTVHVYSKGKGWLDELLERHPGSNYAIFTGTVGDNRKAVVALECLDGSSWFYKLPLTENAQFLVMQEQRNLHGLEKFSFQKIDIPKGEILGKGLLLSNVKPATSSNSYNLQSIHFEALAELGGQTLHNSLLKDLTIWGEVEHQISELNRQSIANDLSIRMVSQIIERLVGLKNSFNPDQTVPSAFAHGDFTPWNCYIGKHKLHIYDWELAGRKPLLFDAFHFVFQSEVLIKRSPFLKIKQELMALEKMPLVRQLLEGQAMGFKRLYQLYLLQNISYYLLKYIRQQPLHLQAFWLVKVWEETLEDEWCLEVAYV